MIDEDFELKNIEKLNVFFNKITAIFVLTILARFTVANSLFGYKIYYIQNNDEIVYV